MAKKRNCFNMLGIAIAAAVIILVLMQDTPSIIENFEASSSNFMDAVSSGKKLVWFYAPWWKYVVYVDFCRQYRR